MDEPPSPLLKSRIPRKTILVDNNLITDDEPESEICDLQCPLQKGIIYYRRDGAIFEHNIYSSGKDEPRIIVPRHPSRGLTKEWFIPIKGNRILLCAKYFENTTYKAYLHLSIHEICSDNRVGPALWSFNGSLDDRFNMSDLKLIKSTKNPLEITVAAEFIDHWKLFDISTTETDALDNFPLIESGRIEFDLKLKLKWKSHVTPSPDSHILLNPDSERKRENETIDIHYLDSGGTNDMNFSFVTRMSIPIPSVPKGLFGHPAPVLAFSADGSKFAMAMSIGSVSVWDIRSKVPLKTLMEVSKPDIGPFKRHLQFSSGNLEKEVLVFVERDYSSPLDTIHVIDATSFEMEEMLPLNLERLTGSVVGVSALFFDPSGGTLYAEHVGTLYEWDLQKNNHGPEWWIGEE